MQTQCSRSNIGGPHIDKLLFKFLLLPICPKMSYSHASVCICAHVLHDRINLHEIQIPSYSENCMHKKICVIQYRLNFFSINKNCEC